MVVAHAAPLTARAHAEEREACVVEAYERGARAHLALCLRMTGSAEDAREVLQGAWERGWRHRGSVQDPAAVDPWLRRIVVRECLRWLRVRQVKRWFLAGPQPPERPDPRPGPEQVVSAEEVRAAATRIVATLSPRQRLVWGLRFDEGWTVPEIAAATGLSADTVRTHLARGLRAVQAGLEVRDGV